LIVLTLGMWLAAASPIAASEPNTNRGGGDYTSMDQSTSDPGECEAACNADSRCQAWTSVRPGVQGPAARCWLKAGVPPPTSDPCCTSGVKGGAQFMSRWDKVSGPGGPWSTGWVTNVPRQICGSSVGCACGGANYCGEYNNGDVIPTWPNGCAAPAWQIRCTSVPQQ
jgi:hypothetical protein